MRGKVIGEGLELGDGDDVLIEKWAKAYEDWKRGKRFIYIPHPSAELFHASKARRRVMIGPVGNGKTTAAMMEAILANDRQRVQMDGVVRDRFAFVRNTLDDLKKTVLNPWLDVFPETDVRSIKDAPELRLVREVGGVRREIEIFGYGLDKAGAERKLRSLPISGAWGSEAQFLSFEVVSAMTERCGRYPDFKRCVPNGWKNMEGVYENEYGELRWFLNHGAWFESNAPVEGEWLWRRGFGGEADAALEEYFVMPPAMFAIWDADEDKWLFEPNKGQRPGVMGAENIDNLGGGWGYYWDLVRLNGPEYALRWVCNISPKTSVGSAVFSTFSETWHVPKSGVPWPAPGTRLYGGVDFGRTPRCILSGGVGVGGRVSCCEEFGMDGVSAEEFGAKMLLPAVMQKGFEPWQVTLFCDPAGKNPTENSNIPAIVSLKRLGFDAKACRFNNNLSMRLDIVRSYLGRIVGSTGALVFDKSNCVGAIRSLGGGYIWKRMRSQSGSYIDGDEPEKRGEHSHIADAVQNLLMGLTYGGDDVGDIDGGIYGTNSWNGAVYTISPETAGLQSQYGAT